MIATALLLLLAAPEVHPDHRVTLVPLLFREKTGSPARDALEWPPVTRQTRPWTRWWWMGSAVDPAGLTRSLEAYRKAGLGGVEITPIYGVRGQESRFIPFLSPEWMRMLRHSLAEARRLDLGVDVATGTGWPFGGPWVGAEHASRRVAHRTYALRGGERLAQAVVFQETPLVRGAGREAKDDEIRRLVEPVAANPDLQALALDQVRFPKRLPLQVLMAYSAGGEVVDLTARVDPEGRLDWTAPVGEWTLVAVFQGPHGKMVERAAPGGEGPVIDHFSSEALGDYLARFDRAFAGHDLGGLRAFFNDSYEVDDAFGQADWTPALFQEFEKRRGYDLRRNLHDLFSEGPAADESARVLADYRETISDLLLERFTAGWRGWAAGKGALVRNQSHGSPGSLLDLYAASDIPETEGEDLVRIRWASSAAHVAGRPLVAAEAATWLGEHFLSTLHDVRRAVDRFFLGGVNHIVYHGTNYTPPGETWPGWLFYAAVHFNPANPWWSDFAALNEYVTRVQSFLQAGEPDHDVLLYFPLYDALSVRGDGLLAHFGSGPVVPDATPFGAAARRLQERGFAFDFVSDRQLRGLRTVDGGRVQGGGASYRAVVLPSMRYVPIQTFEAVLRLAQEGATIVVVGALPADVAGGGDVGALRGAYRAQVSALSFRSTSGTIREARIGKGAVLLGDDLDVLLTRAGVARERMVDRGLQFVRRRRGDGRDYFVVNRSDAAVDGWVPLRGTARSVALFDPLRGRRGHADVRQSAPGEIDVYLQLAPDESVVLVTSPRAAEPTYPYEHAAGAAREITGTWTLRFVTGGPELPPEVHMERLGSWTRLGSGAESFSGTARYSIRFPRPAGTAAVWRLDLGAVRESATVHLNGRDLGTLIGPPYRVRVEAGALQDTSVLEVRVSNLMANRIADLDRRKVPWKRFYNVNFPARLAGNRGPDGLFDASGWAPLDSGLLGPVTLTPIDARPPGGRVGSR